MQKISILLIISCLVLESVVLAHQDALDGHQDTINKIIKKHWQNHLDSLESAKREEILKAPPTKKSFNHKCDHDEIFNPHMTAISNHLNKISLEKRQENVNQEPVVFQKQSSGFDTIRFNVNSSYLSNNDPRACYQIGQTVTMETSSYTCTQEDISSAALQNALKNSIVPTVIDIFEEILTIQRVQGNLQLDPNVYSAFLQQTGSACYYGVDFPKNYVQGFGSGIANTDMYVIPTARPCNEGTVAYALSCNFNFNTNSGLRGRPLVGHLNFCPMYFQDFATTGYSEFTFNAAVKVAVHEFTHAMGFSSAFYDSYLGSNGQPYAGGATTTQTRSGTSPAGNSYNTQVTLINTPSVVAAAKAHYQCNNAAGIELENAGGSGTAGSHWEMRQVQNEYMAGYINDLMPVSYLTLSLFQDMGWYKVDLSKHDYWGWGKDQGCDWLYGRCETTWDKDTYFCNNPQVGYCTPDRSGYGGCNVMTFTNPLPAYYQHFSNSRQGGNNGAPDYCPFFDYADLCANPATVPPSGTNSVVGAGSMCFPVGVGSQNINNVACYKFTCKSQTSLTVTIGSEEIQCPESGGQANSKTLGGTVDCPSASQLCRDPYLTGGNSASGISILVGLVAFLALFLF